MQLNNINITPEIELLVTEIENINNKWGSLDRFKDQLPDLCHHTLINAVSLASKIKGFNLSNRNISSILLMENPYTSVSEEEGRIIGYAEALKFVYEHYDIAAMPISESYIGKLHRMLLKYDPQHRIYLAEYKKINNQVKIPIINQLKTSDFETTSPFRTPQYMQKLCKWLEYELKSGELHPLVLIAVFIGAFISIHPFQQGNNRLSYILTTLLLLQFGYKYAAYAPIEQVVLLHSKEFYHALFSTQCSIDTDDRNWHDWICCFLRMLKIQQQNFAQIIQENSADAVMVDIKTPGLSMAILEIIEKYGHTSVKHIQDITGANRNTIKLHLKNLVQAGKIINHGKGRGSWYGESGAA